jgi:ribonuclease BN (tRNA processing enzyme)
MATPETPRLTFLGTQGWIPTPRRHTTCLALEIEDLLFLFDAGTGLARMLQEPLAGAARRARAVHLFLTHFHLDHSAGLAYLTGLFGNRPLTVHVPDPELNGVALPDGVPALIRRPFHPVAWADHPGYSTHTLAAGGNDIAGITVHVKAQCHPDTSVGYRVEDLFTFVTDTVADAGTAGFARGSQMLLHEAWIDGAEEQDASQQELVRRTYRSHTSARQAAAIAAEAAVGELYLIHLNPLFDEGYYAAMQRSAQAIFPATTVPPDLLVRGFRR